MVQTFVLRKTELCVLCGRENNSQFSPSSPLSKSTRIPNPYTVGVTKDQSKDINFLDKVSRGLCNFQLQN